MFRAALVMILIAGCARREASQAGPSTPPEPAAVQGPEPVAGGAQGAETAWPILMPVTVHVFDWSAADRSELERKISQRRSIVVADRGDSVRLLIDCDADAGGYEFAGHEPRKQHVAAVRHTYDATVIGTWTARTVPMTLQGECTGATHVAREIAVGAFEQATSSTTHNRGDVALPGGGAAGGSFTSTTARSGAGGDVGACVRADAPPAGCAAVITMRADPLPLP